jgi:hypothetical protein
MEEHQKKSKTHRKRVAAFYTLPDAARLLAFLCITEGNQRVCDPACGEGALLDAAYQRKKELIELKTKFNTADHAEFLKTQLIGTDIDPESVQVTIKRLQSHGYPEITPCPNIIRADGLAYPFPEFDVLLMNPPFTRKQLLKHATSVNPFSSDSQNPGDKFNARQVIRHQLQKYYDKHILSNRSSLTSHFLCLMDQMVNKHSHPENIIIGAVLPINILTSQEDRHLRELLQANYSIHYLIFREDRANFSEDTQLQEILLVLSHRGQRNSFHQDRIMLGFITELSPGLIPDIIRTLSTTKQILGGDSVKIKGYSIRQAPGITAVTISQASLDPTNWYLFAALMSKNVDFTCDWLENRKKLPGFVQIGAMAGLTIETKNAAEPTAPDLSFKNTALISPLSRKDRSDLQIQTEDPNELVIIGKDVSINNPIIIPKGRCLPGFRYVTKKKIQDVTDISEWIIYAPPSNENREIAYLDGLDANRWALWQRYLTRRTAQCVLSDRTDLVRPGVHFLAFFSAIPRIIARSAAAIKGITEDQAKLLVLWFNSSFGIMDWYLWRAPQDFTYSQHHKATLNELIVPEYSHLTLSQQKQMHRLFSEIGKKSAPCLLDQYLSTMSPQNWTRYHEKLSILGISSETVPKCTHRQDLDSFFSELLQKHLKKEYIQDIVDRVASILIDSLYARVKKQA